jgi:TonB family protein
MQMKMCVAAIPLAALLCFGAALKAQDAPPPPPAPQGSDSNSTPKRIRIGGNVQSAKMIKQVAPIYPEKAKSAHVQGTVILHVIIAKDGSVQEIQYVSGPALLMRAAMEGVRQWVYAPTLLNGEPVEVDTTISVIFTLGGREAAPGQQAPAAQTPAEPPAQPAAQPSSDIDPQLRADILHLIEVGHMKQQMSDVMRSASQSQRAILAKAFPDTPNKDKIVDSFFEKLAAVTTSPEAMDGLVHIYAKYYSDDEVKQATKFYETPFGQKFVEILPKITADSIQWGSDLAQKAAPEILQQLCTEYPELKEQAKFCESE